MPEPRFEIRRVLYRDPRFVRSEAYDRVLHCEVLLEQPGPAVMDGLGAEEGSRFLREARTLARIQHERVVRLREVTEIDGVPTLVLDLPRGGTLTELLTAEGRLPPDQVVAIARDLAAAAQAVHAAGSIHRGIAPENIFIDAQGRAALAGFTFAKLFDARAGATTMQHGKASGGSRPEAGLPTYSSPEQIAGNKSDHRADVFALGCVLYLATTGRDAYPTTSFDPVVPPRKLEPQCPRQLDEFLRKCIAPSPRLRYQNMVEVGEALTVEPRPARSPAHLGIAIGGLLVLAAIATPPVLRWAVGAEMAGQQRGRPIVPAPNAPDLGYQPKYERSWALVIGCGYAGNSAGLKPLPNAENDAREVAGTLAAIGFEVRSRIGPEATRDTIESDLNTWLAKAGRDDRVVIYFAGHGDLHTDNSLCLLPQDAGPREQKTRWIHYGAVRPILGNTSGPKHVLMILDCCHAGAAQRGLDAGIEGAEAEPSNYQEAVALRLRARWVLTSAMSNELAADGTGKHSPFTQGLLDALAQVKAGKTVDVTDLFTSTKQSVAKSGATQRPWLRNVEGSQTMAEFLFLPPAPK